MNVSLVALSKPYIEGVDSAEELIAYCARVSNPSNQNNKTTAAKLVKYLVDNSHWSPLEMVSMTLEIVTTRDITRQILRHRTFSFQEFSQRYAEVIEFSEPRKARLQDRKNRQNSIEIDDSNVQAWWDDLQHGVTSLAQSSYKSALNEGLAKEQARAVLPEGLTTSRLYMSGTIRSWFHYIQLRTDPSTQKEHREIAEACKAIFIEQFPSLKGLLEEDEIKKLVKQFSAKLESKLRASEDKYEWQDGWLNQHWQDSLKTELRRHVDKSDPMDVAAYCAFANYHGWSI